MSKKILVTKRYQSSILLGKRKTLWRVSGNHCVCHTIPIELSWLGAYAAEKLYSALAFYIKRQNALTKTERNKTRVYLKRPYMFKLKRIFSKNNSTLQTILVKKKSIIELLYKHVLKIGSITSYATRENFYYPFFHKPSPSPIILLIVRPPNAIPPRLI